MSRPDLNKPGQLPYDELPYREPIAPFDASRTCPGGSLPCGTTELLGCGACYIHCLCGGEKHFPGRDDDGDN